MAQTIESDKLFVKDVFNRWYRIPEYQRPYVWGADQVSELLEDISQACSTNPESQYFLGSMVLKRSNITEGNTRYEEYDLLDGQQRLTTLFLLTAVIRDLTNNTGRIKTCGETIFQRANPDDNVPERIRIVFDIRNKVKEFVDDFIKTDGGTAKVQELALLANKKDEDISIRNMAKAILKIREYFSSQHLIDDFFPYLRSNVLMIYVAAEELEDAFRLFTVMNNRGIKLRNSDILKAENLSQVSDKSKRRNAAIQWECIEEYFGEDFDNFLSHLRTMLVKQKAAYSLLKEFEDNIYFPREYDRITKTYHPKAPLLTKGENTFKFINTHFKNYQEIFDKDNYELTNSFEFYNHIQLMRKGFEADFWIAPLLRYFEKFRNTGLVEFTKALEIKFAADWLTGLTPTHRIENINSIIQKIDVCKEYQEVLGSSEMSFSTQNFIKEIAHDIYGRRAARYILLKIDLLFHGHTTKFDPPGTTSVEHILPQNPTDGSEWKSLYSESEHQYWKDKAGNLILISRRKNAAQSNKDFNDKKERYFKSNIELFSNSIRVMNDFHTWRLVDLKHNHMIVVRKLAQGFNITISEDELLELT
ncbi:DUF262 domain-containing HNH endonuclease family protein [Cytophagaceae bacterium ABcell3]|nr:DUF262 domain-containing HNH endonuclease family protein [Cytophagaceae bacterium ABcell3]